MKKSKYKSNIAIVTSSRAEYGLLANLINLFENKNKFNFELVVIGQHLSKKYGMTIDHFFKKKISIKKIKTLKNGTSVKSITKTFENSFVGFSNYLIKKKLNLVILLGDRYETLACANAVFLNNINLAHIQGGEKTYGSMDDTFRHVISKFANIHFTSHYLYKKRLIQLGEKKENIFNVGSLGAENSKKCKLKSKQEILEKYSINIKNKIFLVTFNTSINDEISTEMTIINFLKCLKYFSEVTVIFTLPNSDLNTDKLAKIIDDYKKKNKNFYVFKSLGVVDYLSVMNFCDVVIGNSSSGIFETPSFKKPTVNIGNRQLGRIKAKNIIDCKCSFLPIFRSIKYAMSENFKKKINNVKNPYYKKDTSLKIFKRINKLNLYKRLNKEFVDIQ
jgi:GDP/UDP-N,N'-diacetylbacillosamine 2-epimerase (hydrolysing)